MKKNFLPILLFFLGMQAFSQSIVADYRMNPDHLDQSANANHLTQTGTSGTLLYVTPGSTGLNSDTCVSFTAVRGLVSSQPIQNTNWTGGSVSFWAQSMSQNATGTTGFIIQGAYSGFGVKMSSGRLISFFGGTAIGIPTSNFQFSFSNLGWHHFVAQNNGDSTYLYIDGQLDHAFAEPMFRMAGPNADAKMYIGTTITFDHLDGIAVDELKVFDFFLTPAQRGELILHQNPTIITAVDAPAQGGTTVYPNPSSGMLGIRLTPGFEQAAISVWNASGQRLIETKASAMDVEIELPAVAGVYFVQIQAEGGVEMHKVVRR